MKISKGHNKNADEFGEIHDVHFWHKYYVTSDKDFLLRAAELTRRFNKLTEGEISDTPSPEELATHGFQEESELFEQLLDDFYITADDFWDFTGSGNYVKPLKVLDEGKDEDGRRYVTLRIYDGSTRADCLAAWDKIEARLSKFPNYTQRRREDSNYRLIYAIGKAVRNGKTYAEISKLLTEGKLDAYPYKYSGDESTVGKLYRKHHISQQGN